MNWDLAVEKNTEALKRILALLVAMAGMAVGERDAGGALRKTLPRHLHRFVLRLLRPAEAATRRLIIIAARGLVIQVPRWRPRRPKPVPQPKTILVLDRVNGSIVSVPIVVQQPAEIPARPRSRHTLVLPLMDSLTSFRARRRYARPAVAPHIRSLDGPPSALPFTWKPDPLPSADDPLDATRLHCRLEAIGRALDDLPGQAQRMARWQARRDAMRARERTAHEAASAVTISAKSEAGQIAKHNPRRFHRLSPMRPGRPPGWRRKADHDVYHTLNELHGLAVWARERPDTS